MPSRSSSIAIDSGSSPVEHAADQMRARPWRSTAGLTTCMIAARRLSSSRKKYVSPTTSASTSASSSAGAPAS
jgi:hypothetical protein